MPYRAEISPSHRGNGSEPMSLLALGRKYHAEPRQHDRKWWPSHWYRTVEVSSITDTPERALTFRCRTSRIYHAANETLAARSRPPGRKSCAEFSIRVPSCTQKRNDGGLRIHRAGNFSCLRGIGRFGAVIRKASWQARQRVERQARVDLTARFRGNIPSGKKPLECRCSRQCGLQQKRSSNPGRLDDAIPMPRQQKRRALAVLGEYANRAWPQQEEEEFAKILEIGW